MLSQSQMLASPQVQYNTMNSTDSEYGEGSTKMSDNTYGVKSVSTLPRQFVSPFSDVNHVDTSSEDFHQVGQPHPDHSGSWFVPPSGMAANLTTPQRILSFRNPSNSPLDVPLPAGKETFGTYLLPYMTNKNDNTEARPSVQTQFGLAV